MKKFLIALIALTTMSAYANTWFTCTDSAKNQAKFFTPDAFGLIKIEYLGDSIRLNYDFKGVGYGDETLASVFKHNNEVIFDTPNNAAVLRIDGLAVGTNFQLYRRSAMGVSNNQKILQCSIKTVVNL